MKGFYDLSAPKKATNVSLNSDLLAQSKAMNINLSATLEQPLNEKLSQSLAARWAEDNEAAIAAYGREVEHRIYAYDAYFLECCRQHSCPLLTLDNQMQKVAQTIGIKVLE